MAEDKNDKKINGRGGMLSSTDFRQRVITREKDSDYAKLKELFESRNWDELRNEKKEKSFIYETSYLNAYIFKHISPILNCVRPTFIYSCVMVWTA